MQRVESSSRGQQAESQSHSRSHSKKLRRTHTHITYTQRVTTVERAKAMATGGNYQVSQQFLMFLFSSFFSCSLSRIHCCLFMLRLHYQGNLLKRITITQNLKEIKYVRGPATEMIISPWQAKQLLLGQVMPAEREGEQRKGGVVCIVATRHCSISTEREREREAAIFIWPPCASLVPLSVTNGPVVKKAQNGTGRVTGWRGQWEAASLQQRQKSSHTRAQFTHLKFK